MTDLLREASTIVLFTRATLEHVAHLRERINSLASELGGHAAPPIGVVVVADPREYRTSLTEVGRIISNAKLPASVLGGFALDPKGAEMLRGRWGGRLDRSLLIRSARQIAGGLADAGSMMSTGMVTLEELARIVDQGAPVLHVVKPFRDDDLVLRNLERAAQLGCVAVGMDIDVFFLEKAWDEVPGPEILGHKTIDDLKNFRAATKLPFVLKGVLSAHDARLARAIGADAVIVSSHGGETIDYAMPILQALPAVRAELPDMPILVDSGFRRGADVLKALALGAGGVGIATLLLIACAGGGRDGVRAMMEALYEELARTMSITGCGSVDAIDRSIVHRVELS